MFTQCGENDLELDILKGEDSSACWQAEGLGFGNLVGMNGGHDPGHTVKSASALLWAARDPIGVLSRSHHPESLLQILMDPGFLASLGLSPCSVAWQ
jgi:hypothetical protein